MIELLRDPEKANQSERLRVRLVGKNTEAFQTDHPSDVFISLTAGFGMDDTSHVGCAEMRRLLVGKGDKSERLGAGLSSKYPCQFQKDGNSGGVVIRSGSARGRVIMGTDDVVGLVITDECGGQCLDIGAEDTVRTEFLPAHLIIQTLKRSRQVSCSALQALGTIARIAFGSA